MFVSTSPRRSVKNFSSSSVFMTWVRGQYSPTVASIVSGAYLGLGLRLDPPFCKVL
jgi:hypothetical protein